MSEKVVRIGGASAFLGDSSIAVPQLVRSGQVDYIVLDYLAEVTMSYLARAKARRPEAGYAADFVEMMAENIRDIAHHKVKVIADAGGVNPEACRAAVARVAEEAGINLKIAVVAGDDLMPRLEEIRAKGFHEMFSGEPFPQKLMSMNAYLGGVPIARALALGADVVITGRVVDSALTLGPLIHEFGWALDDWDKLAQGSLAGHINECGAQATGGLHTDWADVPDWANIGYPILECRADGSFIVTKPKGTGGLVTPATVGEQLLYEVGDPQAYLLPDVACDFAQVRITQAGSDRVLVEGAKGRPPTATYKVCATHHQGWRGIAVLPVVGMDARAKAVRQAEAVIERTRRMLRERNLGDYSQVVIEPLGAEATYGAHARAGAAASREVICKIAVEHEDKRGVEIFTREVNSPMTSMSPGSTGWFGGKPATMPVVKLFSFAYPKRDVTVTVSIDGKTERVQIPTEGGFEAAKIERPQVAPPAARPRDTVEVPLIRLAWGRSGDKGDKFNVGLIARKPDYLPWIRAALTEQAVRDWFAHCFAGAKAPRVERFDLPGLDALNFLCHEALGGGGTASLRLDPLAKGMAQQLLEFPVPVPRELALRDGLTEARAA
jgi:hypothetical protein